MLHKNAKKVISGVLGTCLVFQLAALPSLAQSSDVPNQTQTAVTAQENSGVQTLASTSSVSYTHLTLPTILRV